MSKSPNMRRHKSRMVKAGIICTALVVIITMQLIYYTASDDGVTENLEFQDLAAKVVSRSTGIQHDPVEDPTPVSANTHSDKPVPTIEHNPQTKTNVQNNDIQLAKLKQANQKETLITPSTTDKDKQEQTVDQAVFNGSSVESTNVLLSPLGTKTTRIMASSSSEDVHTTTVKSNQSFNILPTNGQEVRHIGFIKVHKAASSTMQNMFFRFGLKRNLTFVLTSHANYFSKKSNEHFPLLKVRGNHSYDILCNHGIFNRTMYASLLPKDSVYLAIVRDPLDVFVSAVNYYGTFLEPMKSITGNKIKELLHKTFKYDGGTFSYTRNIMARDLGFPPTYDKRAVSAYLSNLDETLKLVLLVEHFDESLILMRRYLSWEVQDILYIPNNVYGQGYSLSDFTPDELDLFRDRNKLDYLVYEHYYDKFWKQFSAEGSDIHTEVLYFKNLLKTLTSFCRTEIGPKKSKNKTDKSKEKTKQSTISNSQNKTQTTGNGGSALSNKTNAINTSMPISNQNNSVASKTLPQQASKSNKSSNTAKDSKLNETKSDNKTENNNKSTINTNHVTENTNASIGNKGGTKAGNANQATKPSASEYKPASGSGHGVKQISAAVAARNNESARKTVNGSEHVETHTTGTSGGNTDTKTNRSKRDIRKEEKPTSKSNGSKDNTVNETLMEEQKNENKPKNSEKQVSKNTSENIQDKNKTGVHKTESKENATVTKHATNAQKNNTNKNAGQTNVDKSTDDEMPTYTDEVGLLIVGKSKWHEEFTVDFSDCKYMAMKELKFVSILKHEQTTGEAEGGGKEGKKQTSNKDSSSRNKRSAQRAHRYNAKIAQPIRRES